MGKKPFPRVSRSLFKPLQTRSMTKPDSGKLTPPSENESVIRLRGKTVEWRDKPEFRYPVDIRIKKKAKKHDTRSVHAAVNTPGDKLVAFYRGRVLTCPSGLTKISGKWFITLPGCRGLYVLDSQITEDWPWERYLKEGAVAGFFNSSQPFACKIRMQTRCLGYALSVLIRVASHRAGCFRDSCRAAAPPPSAATPPHAVRRRAGRRAGEWRDPLRGHPLRLLRGSATRCGQQHLPLQGS